MIYRPWQPIPFDITDFSEILPLLTDSTGIGDRLHALISYFLGQGRINLLTSTLIWTHWELFGLWAVGWRLLRILLMGILIWTFLRTALRFGLSPRAAGLGGALFVLSRPASEGWLRLTGEPLAAIFFLLTLGVAVRYHLSSNPLRSSLAMGVFSALMILTKETMISCVPLVWLVAVAWQGELGLRVPKPDRKTLTATAILGTAAVVLASIIVYVSSQSGPEAYAGLYGSGSLDLVRLEYNALATAWPLGEPFQIFSAYGAISVSCVLLGCGIAVRRGPRGPVAAGLLFLLLVCITGPVVYLPWERFEAFYAIPFLVGPAGLLALTARGLSGTSRLGSTLVTGVVAVLLIPPGLDADREMSVRAVTRGVNWELARAVHDNPETDSLFFAVPTLPDQTWWGRGPTLTRYASAVFKSGMVIPSVDETCSGVGDRLGRVPEQREIIVSYHHWCGALPGAEVTITREFRSLHLLPPRVQRSRRSADLLIRTPTSPASGGTPGG